MLVITRECYQQMVVHLLNVFPLEGCGFLSGPGRVATVVHPVHNELRSASAFRMDPAEQLAALVDIEDRELTLAAIFHSHPRSKPYFSEADVAGAQYWPVVHVVVGLRGDPAAGFMKNQAMGYVLHQDQITTCSLKIV